jgi:hypothetical protein
MTDFPWRAIPGTDGKYMASERGDVCKMTTKRLVRPQAPKPSHTPRHLLMVNGKQTGYATFVLVGLAWLGRPPAGHVFALKDSSNPHDVRLENIHIVPATRYLTQRMPDGPQ